MFKRLPTLKSLPQAIGLPFLSSQEDAQLKFKSGENGIKRLYGDAVIPPSDVAYWAQFYTLFSSVQDVYSLITAQDVRQTLLAQPANLGHLISHLSQHLFTLLPSVLFPSTSTSISQSNGQDTTREALNCLRVLGRILVIVYEAEAAAREGGVSSGGAFAREHLWSRRPQSAEERHTGSSTANGSVGEAGLDEGQFTIEDSDEEGDEGGDIGRANSTREGKEDEEGKASSSDNGQVAEDPLSQGTAAPAAEVEADLLPNLIDRLFSCTIDLLFCAGFTVPDSVRGQSAAGEKVNYVIWEKGVGSTVSVGTTAEFDRNKVEVLRFLMILLSTTIYTPPHALFTTPNQPLSHLTHSLERRLVLSLLCSMLNTSLVITKPNTVGQIPYNHLISKAAEERRTLVRACLMTLLVALDHQEPRREEGMGEGKEENAFRFFVSKLHRKEDFGFILNGIFAALEEQTSVSAVLLPGSKQPVPYILEIFMLLWRFVDLNKRFRQYLYDTNRTADLVAYILIICLDFKDDPAQHGLLRLLAYLLQTLSADQAFALALAQPVRIPIPAKWAVSGSGNTADLLIVSIYSIATTPGLNPLFPALTITIANVAPHWKGIGVQASGRLLQLFKAFSAPNFLLADEGHPRLVYYLLETFNSILYHQLNDNPNLVYAILRSHQDFQTLATFTLVSGLRDIQRRKALRAAAAEAASKPAESPGLKRTNSELDMLAEKAALLGREIDGEDTRPSTPGPTQVIPALTLGEGDDPLHPNSNVQVPLQSPPVTSTAEGMTGMSEKARGKMRATESTTSLPLNGDSPAAIAGEADVPDEELMKVAAAGVGPNKYVPTQEWVSSWQKGLPLDPVLVAISELLPKIQDSKSSTGAPSSKVFRLLKEVELNEVLPPAPPLLPRRFQWSQASSIWLTSLLWGDIYVAGLTTSGGVWRDTTVRLFGIKQAEVKGRSAQVGRVLKMIGVV